MALPREARNDKRDRHLGERLGTRPPTGFQRVSRALPKPWPRIAALWLVAIPTPAAAQYSACPPGYVELNARCESAVAVFVFVFLVLAALAIALAAALRSREEHAPKSSEDYDQLAAEYRAKARLLAAEAELDAQEANAALKKQERQDIEDLLRDLRAKRRSEA